MQRKVVEPLLGEFKGVVIRFNGTSLAAHEMSCFYYNMALLFVAINCKLFDATEMRFLVQKRRDIRPLCFTQ